MVCWFCSLIEENPEKSLKLDMYGEVDSKTSDSLTKVAYNVRKILVPRCDSCKSRHSLASAGNVFAAVLFVLFLISIVTTYYVFSETTAFTMGIVTGLLFGLAVAGFLVKISVLNGIKTINNAKRSFPAVKELLLKDYKFGVKPKNHIKESQTEKKENQSDENFPDQSEKNSGNNITPE